MPLPVLPSLTAMLLERVAYDLLLAARSADLIRRSGDAGSQEDSRVFARRSFSLLARELFRAR